MPEMMLCETCSERAVGVENEVCTWCNHLCETCCAQPVESALRWIQEGHPHLCFLCREQSDREYAATAQTRWT